MAAFKAKTEPAKNRKALEAWIRNKSIAERTETNRLRRGLSYMIVAAALARAVDASGVPLFLVKGGVSMELRCGLSARASQDFDAAFRSSMDELLAALDVVVAEEHHGFKLQRTDPEPIKKTHAVRLDLKLTYRGASWATVQLEVGPCEGNAGESVDWVAPFPDLADFAIPCSPVPCMSVPYQVAQKLHACTDVRTAAAVRRFRDLIDLQLLDELIAPEDLAAVRKACIEVFELRDKQPWPPHIVIHESWRVDYARLALDTGFPVTEVEDAAAAVQDLVRRIDQA